MYDINEIQHQNIKQITHSFRMYYFENMDKNSRGIVHPGRIAHA